MFNDTWRHLNYDCKKGDDPMHETPKDENKTVKREKLVMNEPGAQKGEKARTELLRNFLNR